MKIKQKNEKNEIIVASYEIISKVRKLKKVFLTYVKYVKKNTIVKYAHDSLTGNMLGHLWFKHRIDKDHSGETIRNLILLIKIIITQFQYLFLTMYNRLQTVQLFKLCKQSPNND